MSQNLNPVVFWAQTETRVSLKVDLKDVKVSTLITSRMLMKNNILFSRPPFYSPRKN